MTTQRFIITKDSAYAMVTEDSSEMDKVFSLAQAQTIRKFMASKYERWEKVGPNEAIRVELTLDGNNTNIAYYASDANLIALFEELLEKEEKSINMGLLLHEGMVENGDIY